MMRWPLYLTLNAGLILLMGAGFLGIIQRNTSLQRAQGEAMTGSLDRLIASWTAAGTPPENRLLNVLVSGEPEESMFVPAEERPIWAPIWSWFTRGKARTEHARLASALLGRERPMADWYAQGSVWASERERRLQALAGYLAKARQAQARIVVVADGREAAAAWAAIQTAGQSSANLVLVEKFITLGYNPDALRRNRRAAFVTDGSELVKERLFLWHAEGTAVLTAGNQMVFVDSQGRRVREALPGEAAKEEGAVGLVRRLADADSSIETRLRNEGILRVSLDGPVEEVRPAVPAAAPARAAPRNGAIMVRREPRPVREKAPAVETPKEPAKAAVAPSPLDSGPDHEHVTVEVKDFSAKGEGTGWTVTGPRLLLKSFDKNRWVSRRELLLAYPQQAEPPADCGIDLRFTVLRKFRSIEDFAAADYFRTGTKLFEDIVRGNAFGYPKYGFLKGRRIDSETAFSEQYCLVETERTYLLTKLDIRTRSEESGNACNKAYASHMTDLCESLRPMQAP